MAWAYAGPLGEGLASLGLVQVCPRMAIAPKHMDVRFGVKHSVQVRHPQSVDLHLCWGMGVGEKSHPYPF